MVELEETPEERLSVEVRGISSGWTRHVAVVDRPLRVGQQIQQSAISLTSSKFVRWAVVVTTTLWIVGIAMLVRREAPVVERTELPTGLDDRAVLFADALVRRDMDVLTRLTDPAEHRAMRIWVAHGKDLPQQASAGDQPIKPELVLKNMTTPKGDDATIKVRLRLPPSANEFVLNEHRSQRGDTWYFRPVRVRSPRMVPPMPPERRGRAAR
jgi:hypothetical protein